MDFAPDGRLFICQQAGQVRVVKNGQLLPIPFVTVNTTNSGQRGLLGLAFDPGYATNGFFYVYYTVPTAPVHNRVSRFTADPAHPDVALADSEHVVLELDNLSSDTLYNGGAIHFGLDGKLYVGVGENDIPANSQNLGSLLGKVLRINADGSAPPDNPFVGQSGARPEVWAYGFRNPFTFAVQPGTGRIYVNDVGSTGDARREEVNNLVKGGNYGWPTYEGYTNVPGYQSPVFAYDQSFGGFNCAITGGTFYNPPVNQYPSQYVGKYFFQDLCGSWIYYLDPAAGDPKTTVTQFATDMTSGTPVDLKVGPDGSLYYLLYGGFVYRASSFASTATLTSSLPVSNSGQSVQFTVTVKSDLGTPPGNVTFFDRTTTLKRVDLVNGQATFTTAALSPGNHSITAVYGGSSGNPPFQPGTSNAVGQVVRAGESVFALGGAPGRVQVRRVKDGSLAADFAPYGANYTGPVAVALGDINDDGFQDLVTGALAGNPDVRVYDGKALATGSFDPAAALLAQWFAYGLGFNVGANVAVGDVTNDGFADVVTGATAGNPDVRVYSGKDIAQGTFHPDGASRLVQFFAYGLNFNVGANVAAGDVNGDGFADVLTGPTAGNPDVHLYSGRDAAGGTFDPTGSRLAAWFAFGLNFNVGANVAAGDVNDDGFVDVIAGATAGNPHVRVYSGRDIASGKFQPSDPGASQLDEFFAYQLQFNVGVKVGAADFDGDGKADLLTGASAGSPHYRVVKADSTGVLPPAINGIEGIPAEFSGGITVAA
jgi:glucose/arabinose dehydrogenase